MRGTVKNLIESLLRHGDMDTPVRIYDVLGKPRAVELVSGGGRSHIELRPMRRLPRSIEGLSPSWKPKRRKA
jgi:hypothetical protein